MRVLKRYFLTAFSWIGFMGLLWSIPFFAEAGPLHADYERFVLQRLMIAKVRQYNGDGSAGMLLKELRKEARRNGIRIPAWAESGSYKKLTGYMPTHQRRSLAQYDDLITRASKTYRLSPALIKAVIKVESGFIEDAVSRAGAQGLMQLMPDTADEIGVQNAFDPKTNILGGSKLLRRYLNEFGSLKKALIAYNAGPDRVRKGKRIPSETRKYIKRVIHYYRIYRKGG
ncbi:MAG: lytic transglycosylase domain-containing protein [Deltaproteobacteria bacterium]|nr:lytic transglycosylase domain-containing protein [Deltaproteobacteria bacterium]